MYPVGGERLARVLRRQAGWPGARGARLLRLSCARGRDPGAPTPPRWRRSPGPMRTTSMSPSAPATTSQPYFERRFDDRETHEVRLMMWGGDDRVVVRGSRRAEDHGVESWAERGTICSWTRPRPAGCGSTMIEGGTSRRASRRVAINTRHSRRVGRQRHQPVSAARVGNLVAAAALDRGEQRSRPLYRRRRSVRTQYGFRRTAVRLRDPGPGAGTPPAPKRAGESVEAELHPENASHFWRLRLRASGVDVLRFYGLGNDTPNAGSQRLLPGEPAALLGRAGARGAPRAAWSM